MRVTHTGSAWVFLLGIALLAGWAAIVPIQARQQSPQSSPEIALMRHHFASVMSLHEAVTRGDLEESRRIARQIAVQPAPPEIAASLHSYVDTMQFSARRVSGDSVLEDLAASTGAMLAACGDCHRAAGTMPAPPTPTSPEVGGLVGHMLSHERAVDLMVQGLIIPSASAWDEGAKALTTAPLRSKDLPRDPQLTRSIRAAEKRVHELAEQAVGAPDPRSRIYFYSELLQSCASCHTLHQKVWGPRRH